MQNAKVVKLFEAVLAKTRSGKIRWSPTATESDYIAAIGGHFILSISELENGFAVSPATYTLALKDQDGRELTRVQNVDEGIPSLDIRELYEAARRQALHVDEKIDSLLEALSKL
jgi:hypothetical protein